MASIITTEVEEDIVIYIVLIKVAPFLEHSGVGRAFVGYIESFLLHTFEENHSYKRAFLVVNASTKPNVTGFYTKLGFDSKVP